MNPQYMAAGFVHTVPEKLSEYFLEPFTDVFVVISLIAMITNIYMFRKLRKIKKRDYIEIINLFTIGIYAVVSIISSVLVSRLGPHGNLYKDDCDYIYMIFPKALFMIVAIINVIYFVINIVTKFKKDKEYKETVERGYFAEERKREETYEDKEKTNHINGMSFIDNIKDKIDMDKIKDKISNIAEDAKEMINSKLKKDE